jgi:hypothetical protein
MNFFFKIFNLHGPFARGRSQNFKKFWTKILLSYSLGWVFLQFCRNWSRLGVVSFENNLCLFCTPPLWELYLRYHEWKCRCKLLYCRYMGQDRRKWFTFPFRFSPLILLKIWSFWIFYLKLINKNIKFQSRRKLLYHLGT